MIDRRFVIFATVFAMGLSPLPALAAEGAVDGWTTFDAAAFAAAQSAGKPILLHVTAPWCPYCKAQKPILANLLQMPDFKDTVTFEIDFDSNKDLLHRFNVLKQSTLISFKGTTEVGRSTGLTQPDAVEAQLRKAL